jgi:hypothetical protein
VSRRSSTDELKAAAELLLPVAAEHGFCDLRIGDEPGDLVARVGPSRTYFDTVAFEGEVEWRLGWRPAVVPATAPGARPVSRLVGRVGAA